MTWLNNRWMRAAVPALLIHCSVGTVYCWSIFKQAIADTIGMSTFSVGWAFSLAIFFLGMSAAFMGSFIERDIYKSSLLACILFSVGMIGTGLTVKFLTGIPALIGIYLFYGVIMGMGLGIGYLTPVKTLMLWFSDNKGLATGISIMGFGLAKMIATPLMNFLQSAVGIANMFYILGILYFILMFLGHFLLKKPQGWKEITTKTKTNIKQFIKNKQFIGIWLMFFINIHCGLMIISYEKQILNTAFIAATSLPLLLSLIPSITAGFNAFGRIGYSALSDKMKERNSIYIIVFLSCIIISLIMVITNAMSGATSIVLGGIVLLYLFIVNAGYGGGFSTLPALLSERFGMKNISQIHGLTLSAWAVAGLTGNNTSELILSKSNNYSLIILVALILYIVALAICLLLVDRTIGTKIKLLFSTRPKEKKEVNK